MPNVSAPDPSLPVPDIGAQAAPDISFQVPAGLDRLDADMIWPEATNGTILNFVLTDPSGRLRQISYDYGTAATRAGALGTVPNIQHVEVANPEAGTWKVQIKWGNGRDHLQSPPNVPGTYTGPASRAYLYYTDEYKQWSDGLRVTVSCGHPDGPLPELLAASDYVHVLGSLCTLVIVVGLSGSVLTALLHGQAQAAQRSAAFLATLVLSPLLYLGTALLYLDQSARLRSREGDAGLHPPLDADAAGRADASLEPGPPAPGQP